MQLSENYNSNYRGQMQSRCNISASLNQNHQTDQAQRLLQGHSDVMIGFFNDLHKVLSVFFQDFVVQTGSALADTADAIEKLNTSIVDSLVTINETLKANDANINKSLLALTLAQIENTNAINRLVAALTPKTT